MRLSNYRIQFIIYIHYLLYMYINFEIDHIISINNIWIEIKENHPFFTVYTFISYFYHLKNLNY